MPFGTDQRTARGGLHERISDLAYRLWQARGCPLGSPEVDWFLAERLGRDCHDQASPFDEFIRKATRALNTPTVARDAPDDSEYVRVIEERRYAIDILDRVEMLAFAYSRLKALSDLYREAETLIEAAKRVTKEEPLTFEVPDAVVWQRDLRALEACVLVSFIYYEVTSLMHMLNEGLKVDIPQGELQYLVKNRDKFLAHPALCGPVRNAHGSISISNGGLLHPDAVHADEKDPVLLDHYGSQFDPKDEADEARLRRENERLILSKRNDQFSSDEKSRLKAFGIREPSPEAALEELARLLLTSVLPEIERISSQPIPSRH